jgi:hypothetical protein
MARPGFDRTSSSSPAKKHKSLGLELMPLASHWNNLTHYAHTTVPIRNPMSKLHTAHNTGELDATVGRHPG